MPPTEDLPVSAAQARALTGNQTSNLFGLQAGAQSTEPHQPGLFLFVFKVYRIGGVGSVIFLFGGNYF